jgi:hypothetical protein
MNPRRLQRATIFSIVTTSCPLAATGPKATHLRRLQLRKRK